MQSSVQQNGDQLPHLYESIENGVLDTHNRSQKHDRYLSTNHHHIQVEPTNTFKRTSSPVRHQQIIDVQPNITVQHQRPPSSRSNSAANTLLPSTKEHLNEAYIERDHTSAQLLTIESTYTYNDNDSTSTLKQYDNQQERKQNPSTSTPPPSPVTQELSRIWKKQRNKYSIKSTTAATPGRKTTRSSRPPGRLKNYEDESDSETTATETQSKDEGM
jgi:hypothetical protein